MDPHEYRDYTRLGLNVVVTSHAWDAIRDRGISREDVLYVLQIHDADLQGDQPHKRELMGSNGRGRIKVVVALHAEAGEIRVVTVHQEPRQQWQPRRYTRQQDQEDA